MNLKKTKKMNDGKTSESESLSEMDLLSHLNELRSRLIRCIIYLFAGMLASYVFKERVLDIVIYPILKLNPGIRENLVFISPAEGFLAFIRLSVYSGLLIVMPLVFYELWQFVKPGLYKRERNISFSFFMISLLLFYAGLMIAYLLVIPYGFNFLLGFAGDQMTPMISIREFVIFIFKVLILFGIIFETPLVLFIMSLFGIINSKMLSKFRRYIIILIFIAAAMLTPPDPVTQILLAIPLVILYEISIIVIKIGEKKN